MATCYQLIGVPGSGKTTWAKNQNWFADCAYVSTDKWVEFFAEQTGLTYSEAFPMFIETAVACMLREVEVAKQHNRDIIWDQTSISSKSRKKKFDVLPDYEHIAVVFLTPDAVELNQRLGSRPGKLIPDHIIKQMIKDFQMPSSEEKFKELWFAG